jgi:hypothetical protein
MTASQMNQAPAKTTAVAVSEALATMGHKVLLIDADHQCASSELLLGEVRFMLAAMLDPDSSSGQIPAFISRDGSNIPETLGRLSVLPCTTRGPSGEGCPRWAPGPGYRGINGKTVGKNDLSVDGGISPKVGVPLVLIGVACVASWFFLNLSLELVLVTTLGLVSLLAGIIGPSGYFRLTRLQDGIRYERRYSSRFFPFSTIRDARLDLELVGTTHHFQKGTYTHSSASFRAHIVLITTAGDVPIELNSFMPYGRNTQPTFEASLAEAWSLLQRRWRGVLLGPDPSSIRSR